MRVAGRMSVTAAIVVGASLLLTATTTTTTMAFTMPRPQIQFGSSRSTGVRRVSGTNGDVDIPTLVNQAASDAVSQTEPVLGVSTSTTDDDDDDDSTDTFVNLQEDDEPSDHDITFMQMAIDLAKAGDSPFPKPMAAAVIVTKSGKVLGKGRTDFRMDCVMAAVMDAGLTATALREWCVTWPCDRQLRQDVADATLYLTLEPSSERKGQVLPPLTQLIAMSGIPRVVIGSPDPVPERATIGAATLHSSGLDVTMGLLRDDCQDLVEQYAIMANSKLQRMARKQMQLHQRPLGFLHCSVIDSEDAAAFARHGNAFGKNSGGQLLSYRDFGSYELAPPPESVWAVDEPTLSQDDDDDDSSEGGFADEVDDTFDMVFEEEDYQEVLSKNPMMPWYEQMDAVVATFPKKGNGPAKNNSLEGRLTGLQWLATGGNALPANVERILVMDANDLVDLPLTNDAPGVPAGLDVEAFWTATHRKPSRILLRHGGNAQAIAAAKAAAKAAAAAADAALAAQNAISSGDAEMAAEAALECQQAATAATEFILQEMQTTQAIKQKLLAMGTVVETLKGGDPIDVMNFLGKRSGYNSVVWRAGCWGERGVEAILKGAFQWVSAHLAVDAVGGKFWQLMLAERAVQAACGPERKVKLFAEQEGISLEYCDQEDADKDCVLTVDGRPVRHVRLDCRVALIDETRPREFAEIKTVSLTPKFLEEEAPWFL